MKPRRLFRFPQQGKKMTLCNKTLHPWTPLELLRIRIDERTEAELMCARGRRYRVYSSEIAVFPDIVTITRDHDGHDIWTTFDFIHDLRQQREDAVVVRCRRTSELVGLPLSIVEGGGQHIPPETVFAV